MDVLSGRFYKGKPLQTPYTALSWILMGKCEVPKEEIGRLLLQASKESREREEARSAQIRQLEQVAKDLVLAKGNENYIQELLKVRLKIFERFGLSPKERAFQNFLIDIRRIMQNNAHNVSLYISYAWEDNSTNAGKADNQKLHTFLLRLKGDLETLGVTTFLDLDTLTGNINHCMMTNIATSNRFLVIGTERLQARAADPNTNVGKEWAEIKQRMQQDPNTVIPLLYQGEIKNSPPYTNAFPAEIEHNLIRVCKEENNYYDFMANMINPLSFIQTLFEIRNGGSNADLLGAYEASWKRLEGEFKIFELALEKDLLLLSSSSSINSSSTAIPVNSSWNVIPNPRNAPTNTSQNQVVTGFGY